MRREIEKKITAYVEHFARVKPTQIFDRYAIAFPTYAVSSRLCDVWFLPKLKISLLISLACTNVVPQEADRTFF